MQQQPKTGVTWRMPQLLPLGGFRLPNLEHQGFHSPLDDQLRSAEGFASRPGDTDTSVPTWLRRRRGVELVAPRGVELSDPPEKSEMKK
jgi:hypothetical protein